MTSNITVHNPKTLAEALSVLKLRGEKAKVLAGGTDLMVYINTRVFVPQEVLSIWRLQELRFIREESDSIVIGGLITYTEIIRSPLVAAYCPILIDAAKTIGAVQIQNRGTLGGNVVNASPAGDALPVLSAFEAELELMSVRGARHVQFNEFYTGYRASVITSDELLTAIRIPKQRPAERSAFYKVGTRKAQAISKVVMALKADVHHSKRIESIQVSLGSVAPTVMRARQTEQFLSGKSVSPSVLSDSQEMLRQEIRPIDDIRSTERYRRIVSANLLQRFLRSL